jgi:tetratricopeptide (TPR) repeat protein
MIRFPRTWPSAAGLELRDKLAGTIVVVSSAASGLVIAAKGPAWLEITFPACGVLAAVLGVGLRLRGEYLERREGEKRDWHFPPVRLREAMRGGMIYDAGVDTEAPESLDRLGLHTGQHPRYVSRAIDHELAAKLKEGTAREGASLVIVSGPSKAGKSRTLFEVAARVLGDAWLITPKHASAVARLASDGPPRNIDQGVCVVWVDDIEDAARRTEGLNADTLRAFAEWNRPVVVLATQGGKGIWTAGALHFQEITRDLLTRYPVFPLEPALTAIELARVRDQYPSVAAEQIAREGLGEFMIAAPRLLDKLRNGGCREGQAITRAAIDCQRAGMLRPISVEQLESVFGQYLPGPASAERFARGLAWAAEPLYSTVALLRRDESSRDEYRAHEYLVDYARRHEYPIDGAVWDRVIRVFSTGEDELLRIGSVAWEVNDTVRAETAWRRADAGGSAHAANSLGWLLQKRGDAEGAEAAYRRAEVRGHPHGAARLGLLLWQRSDEGAEAALRRADELGDPQGACWLGSFLKQRGNSTSAEGAFRRAEHRGHAHGATELGRLLQQRGDSDAAETAFRRADEGGDADGAFRLGWLLWLRGDTVGAEAAYQRADSRGSAGGASYLGWSLWTRGDYVHAEAAYRRADSRGDGYGASQLGWVLESRGGDLNAAEAAYRRGDSRGDRAAARLLGAFLERRCDIPGAEASWRRAHERGDTPSTCRLAELLRRRGEVDGTESLYRHAEEQRDAGGPYGLGEILEERCDSAGA